jgi:hypothetical protein
MAGNLKFGPINLHHILVTEVTFSSRTAPGHSERNPYRTNCLRTSDTHFKMSDPLSVSVSIIAILQLTGTIIDYLKDVHDAPQDRINFLVEISGLDGLLDALQKRVQEAKSGDPWLTELQALGVQNGPLDQLDSDLKRLTSKLEPLDGLKEVRRRLTWKFSKTEIKDILSKIERIKTLVTFALTNNILCVPSMLTDNKS